MLKFKYSPNDMAEKSRPVVLYSQGIPVFGMRCSIEDARRLVAELNEIIANHERSQ